MANSSVCPSPRTVPAHAGAAHAASGVSPWPGPPLARGTRRHPNTRQRRRARPPRVPASPPQCQGWGPAVTNTPAALHVGVDGVLCHRSPGIKALPVRLVLQ